MCQTNSAGNIIHFAQEDRKQVPLISRGCISSMARQSRWMSVKETLYTVIRKNVWFMPEIRYVFGLQILGFRVRFPAGVLVLVCSRKGLYMIQTLLSSSSSFKLNSVESYGESYKYVTCTDKLFTRQSTINLEYALHRKSKMVRNGKPFY